jgi:exoribonuclease-2
MFAMRRLMRRSQYRVTPAGHAGLGLPHYAQVTSPLRRCLDLAAHQQLRAFLAGQPALNEGALLERIGMVEAALPALRQAEQASEKHWTLVHLLRNPGWRGQAVLVDRRGAQGTLLIPDLALEARASLSGHHELDSLVPVEIRAVDLPGLEFNIRTVT